MSAEIIILPIAQPSARAERLDGRERRGPAAEIIDFPIERIERYRLPRGEMIGGTPQNGPKKCNN